MRMEKILNCRVPAHVTFRWLDISLKLYIHMANSTPSSTSSVRWAFMVLYIPTLQAPKYTIPENLSYTCTPLTRKKGCRKCFVSNGWGTETGCRIRLQMLCFRCLGYWDSPFAFSSNQALQLGYKVGLWRGIYFLDRANCKQGSWNSSWHL